MQSASKALRAVGYLRRSTDQQDRSLGDQRIAVEAYALLHELEVIDYYIDDAISGTRLHGRTAFQQMIDDACSGVKGFKCILVYDVKRFGRMDNDETGYFRHLLRMHGVRVCYASEGFTDSFLDDLIRPVKQWQARQESKDLAKVVIRGYLSKFFSRGGGWWMCGVPPWGYDRRYEDSEGRFICIVRNMLDRSKQIMGAAGNVIRTLSPGIRLPMSDQDRCRLVLSESERVALIRRIFFECNENGLGGTAIANRLNHEGIPTPRNEHWGPRNGGLWRFATIRMILLNPAYAGDIVWNRSTKGTFFRITNRQAVERPLHETATSQYNRADDWLVMPDAHEAIVSRAVFEQAGQIIHARLKTHRRFSPDYHRDESDYRAQYVLTGLLRCAKCGKGFWGTTATRTYAFRRSKPYRSKMYRCGDHDEPHCKRCRLAMIRKRVLEKIVIARIVDWYGRYLARDGCRHIQDAAIQQCKRVAKSTTGSAFWELDAARLAQGAIDFIARLRGELTNNDLKVQRLAFRRCIDQIMVDVPGRRLSIVIKRLPILGAAAGCSTTITAHLPTKRCDLAMGAKKRIGRLHPAYDVAWHLGRKPDATRQLALHVRTLLLAVGPDVNESIHQRYFSFSLNRHFANMKVLHEKVLIYLKLDPSKLKRRRDYIRDVTGLGTQTTGNVELTITTAKQLKESMPMIKQAYISVRRSAGGMFPDNT